jgi:hypothetical protein
MRNVVDPLRVQYLGPVAKTGDTSDFCPSFEISDGQQQVGVVVVKLSRTAETVLRGRLDHVTQETIKERLPDALITCGQRRVEQRIREPGFLAKVRGGGEVTETVTASEEGTLAELADLIQAGRTD